METVQWSCLAEPDLVVEAQYGNLSAFDEIVRRYRVGALMQARTIAKQTDLAEDAVQDAFLAAYKALPSLSDSRSFGSWFGAIVRHRALRLVAGERRPHVPLDDVILAHTPAIIADLERDRRQCELRQAIVALGDDLAAPMNLYYLDDWKVSAIADFLGLSRATVKWRLHTGRNRLRTALTQDWEELNEPGN